MRKSLVVAPAAAVIAMLAGAASAQTVKIGVINTYSGPTAQQGDMLERGIQLYTKLHQKDLPAASRCSSSSATIPAPIPKCRSAWRKSW